MMNIIINLYDHVAPLSPLQHPNKWERYRGGFRNFIQGRHLLSLISNFNTYNIKKGQKPKYIVYINKK